MSGFPGFDGIQTAVVAGAPAALPAPCTHCGGKGHEPAPGRLLLSLVLPIKTVSEANQRARWAVTKRKAEQRKTVRARLEAWQASGMAGLPLLRDEVTDGALDVVLTRITPSARGCDDDNLASSFKAIRDEVAAWLGIDDRDPRVRWRCEQEKGAPKVWAVRIEIRERRAPGAR